MLEPRAHARGLMAWIDGDERRQGGPRELTPLRRLLPPGDIASAAVFLASDASASITGDDMNLSGGLAMH